MLPVRLAALVMIRLHTQYLCFGILESFQFLNSLLFRILDIRVRQLTLAFISPHWCRDLGSSTMDKHEIISTVCDLGDALNIDQSVVLSGPTWKYFRPMLC